MRKILIAFVLFGGLALSSCNDFLDEEIEGEYTSSNIFDTADDADLVLTGAYNGLNFTTSSNEIWVFGDVASDDSEKGGGDSDGSDIGLIDNFNVTADNGILLTYWQFAYEGINRANTVINGVYNSAIADSTKQLMIGQAKFIRAYYYFNLVNIWGEVPLRTEVITTSNVNTGLSSVSTIYAQIDSDLVYATNALPAVYASSSDAGRITKGAALGLLAKSLLYQEDWTDCITTINELEDLGIYSLETNYADLFKLGAEDSPEAIFAIRHLSNQSPGVGNCLNQWFAPSVENGYYFNAPTSSYVAAFNEQTASGDTDPRLDASIGREGQSWLNDDVFDASWGPATGYLVKKHNQPLSEVPVGTKGDGGLPYIYLRYADILLMKAEAYMQTNDLSNAAVELNRVRSRAGLADISVVSQSQMKSVIYLERRREMGFEFHRFFDLMRWGEDIATAALGSNFVWEDPRYYFPIPQSELDSNSAIVQ
jgi:starch-binding outer membrane protein, SusD/RagB family